MSDADTELENLLSMIARSETDADTEFYARASDLIVKYHAVAEKARSNGQHELAIGALASSGSVMVMVHKLKMERAGFQRHLLRDSHVDRTDPGDVDMPEDDGIDDDLAHD